MTRSAKYRFGFHDVVAGVSVALVVIPQSLAYAEIAGMPPYTGLYAAALPAIAAAPLASSRYLQTGPVAMTALLSFGALSAIAEPATDEYVGLAMLLAIVVGVARLALGAVKGGMITNYMSPSVVLGFTTAATLLIVASQSALVVGLPDPDSDLMRRAVDVVANPGTWNWEALALSVVVAIVIIGGRRVHPLFPGVLLAVVVGIAVSAATSYSGELVGQIPAGFPPFSLSLPWSRIPELVVPGIIIAAVGFAEPTAIARTMAVHDRERWDASRELISQGLANVASGISGGFPVGGSFSRSSINRVAGARSPWAGAVTGLAVLAFMPFAGVLAELPLAVLGGIVIVAVFGLIRIPDMVRLARVSWGQAFVAWSTAAATILLSPRVDLAVLFGVLVAAGVHIYRESSRTRVVTNFKEPELEIRLGGVLFYASVGALEEALTEQVAANPTVERLVLDLGRLGRIDHSGVMMLRTFVNEARLAGLEVRVANIPSHAQGIFQRVGGI